MLWIDIRQLQEQAAARSKKCRGKDLEIDLSGLPVRWNEGHLQIGMTPEQKTTLDAALA